MHEDKTKIRQNVFCKNMLPLSLFPSLLLLTLPSYIKFLYTLLIIAIQQFDTTLRGALH